LIIPPIRSDPAWRVSRDCDGGSCIRVALHKGIIVIGDTKNPEGSVLSYTHYEWVAFLKGIKQGDFDDLV
jgi:hypothetical protein